MIPVNHLTNFLLVLIVSASLINVGQSSESGNWLTKSLDYFSLAKCSPLDKSGITGDFYGCLNSPVDSSSSSTGSTSPSPPSGQGKSGSGNWGKFGSKGASGLGGFGSSSGFSGKSGLSSKKSQSSPDSWPLSLVDDLKHMINCFPKLMKPCMTESEVQFFTTIKDFFQSQVNYASPNASLIAAQIASSGCVKSNSIDTSTICYSTNIHKQNWFGWKINWVDGQMCHFIDDISKCEASSFDKCPPAIRQFADGLWEAGLKVTPCLDQSTTSSSSPLPVTSNPPAQTKLLAPGSSVDKIDSNQSPSRLTNVDNVQSKPLVLAKPFPRFPGKMNDNNVFDGFDRKQQFDDNNENEDEEEEEEEDFEDGFDVDEKTRDFKGKMKHSKLVRLHEVDGEGESRHDHDKKHRDIEEEQWSRIKEEFRRKMRESIESQESDESEYEEESEESDEDKNMEIFENRKNPFEPMHRNEEDDYMERRKGRKDMRDSRDKKNNRQKGRRSEEERERERKHREMEYERRHEEEERMREAEERRLEEDERRREDEQRQMEEEDERRREEMERNLEKRREEARRMNEEKKRHEKIFRPPQPWVFPDDDWRKGNNHRNHGNEKGSHSEQHESRINDCFKSLVNSWSSHDHNSDDMMDSVCRNMDSLHSCLDKHAANKSNGQANGFGHLKMVHLALCDKNNRPKDDENIEKVRQCLTGHSPSIRPTMQTKYPSKYFPRFWNN